MVVFVFDLAVGLEGLFRLFELLDVILVINSETECISKVLESPLESITDRTLFRLLKSGPL